jgi:hypothetical protein
MIQYLTQTGAISISVICLVPEGGSFSPLGYSSVPPAPATGLKRFPAILTFPQVCLRDSIDPWLGIPSDGSLAQYDFYFTVR